MSTSTEAKASGDDLKARYDRLVTVRDMYLDRARECSLLTLPQIFPKEEHTAANVFYRPYQSIGARGVNNLANKLLLSLLPPNTPFFKLSADDATVAELADDKSRAKVEEKFNEIERSVQTFIETGNYRAPFVTLMKQLIIGGNSLLLLDDEGYSRVINLANYVVRRDNKGRVLEIIIKEKARYDDLDPDIQALISANDLPSENKDQNKDCEIYTVYKLVEKQYKTYQTIKGIKIPDTGGSYPQDKPPFIALRWSFEDNEDYGRSYVEEYIGDLQTAEGLSKAIVEASAAAAKVVIMVASNGLTREDDVAKAENLDVISGRADDVTMLQLNKAADMQVAKDVLNDILQRVSYAFLMNTAVQRDAERVTAEEIREMVKELEDALGGTYALFAQEFQLPFVNIIMNLLTKKKRIPDLASLKRQTGVEVSPSITTGVEAIGRGNDLGKLQTFMAQFVVPFGEAGMAEVNVPDFLKRAGVSLGIDMDGLVKSPEDKEKAMAAQKAQQQEALMSETMSKGAVAAAGPVAKAAAEQGMMPDGSN